MYRFLVEKDAAGLWSVGCILLQSSATYDSHHLVDVLRGKRDFSPVGCENRDSILGLSVSLEYARSYQTRCADATQRR